MTCVWGGIKELWTPYTPPRSIMRGWYNPDDHGSPAMIDDGAGLISSWKNRLTGVNAATGLTTQRPTWSATGWRGIKPAVTFDGLGNYLDCTDFTNYPAGAASLTMEFWASAIVNGASVQMLARYGSIGGLWLGVTTPPSSFTVSDGNISNTNVGAVSAGTAFILGAYYNNTAMGGRINGRDFSPTPTVAVPGTSEGANLFRLGANNAAINLFWNGPYRQFLITSRQTSAQRLQLEGWLAWDGWPQGPADPLWPLPSSHPYYAVAP